MLETAFIWVEKNLVCLLLDIYCRKIFILTPWISHTVRNKSVPKEGLPSLILIIFIFILKSDLPKEKIASTGRGSDFFLFVFWEVTDHTVCVSQLFRALSPKCVYRWGRRSISIARESCQVLARFVLVI